MDVFQKSTEDRRDMIVQCCAWARGILIVTSFLDNPQQWLPWA